MNKRQETWLARYRHTRRFLPRIQSIYSKLVLSPAASGLVAALAKQVSIKPWHLTLASLLLGIVSALCFHHHLIITAVILFQVSTLLDCADGLLARAFSNGCIPGILADVYSDIGRLILCGLGLASSSGDTHSGLAILVFLALGFSEALVDKTVAAIKADLVQVGESSMVLNSVEVWSLRWSDNLGKLGLKLNFLHHQERLLLVFAVGPITGHIFLFTLLGIALCLISLLSKAVFDLALVKKAVGGKGFTL